jgi:hypothetical protein
MIFNRIKRVIFLAAALLVSKNVTAQTFFNNARADYDSYYENQFGFEANANISHIIGAPVTGAPDFQTSGVTSFSAGIHFILPLRYPVTIEPIVLFSQKGFIANTPYGRYTQRSKFIDVPVLAKISIVGPLKVYVGPQVSLLMNTDNTYDPGFAESNLVSYEYTGSKITYQGVAGLGFDLSTSIEFHARYTIDMVKKYGNSNQRFVPPYRNSVIQLGAGFNF